MTALSNQRLYNAFLIFMLLCTALSAAGTREEPAQEVTATEAYPLTLTDSFKRVVSIPSPPERIISLGPNITETLFALEQEDRLVGRTEWCDYPAETAAIPVVGSLMNPNMEEIASLKPDLVIASTHFQKESLGMMEQLGIPTLVLYGKNEIDGVYEIIRGISAALAIESSGEEYINAMQERISSLISRLEGREKPRVYYVIGFGESGNYTAGGDTFIHQLIELSGGINVAADLEGWSYSLEMLLNKDPDILICSDEAGVRERLMETPGYRELTAVKSGQVYSIDVDTIDRQGPRLVQGLESLAAILHPDIL